MALVACGGGRSLEETEAIYIPDRGRAQRRASSIVFVPGILGSELHDPQQNSVWGAFWTGRPWDEQLRALSLPWASGEPIGDIRDDIVPGGQLMAVSLDTPFLTIHARAYPAIFEGLVAALVQGETHHAPEALSMDEVLEDRDPIVGFGYDWRRDLASETERFDEVVRSASEHRRQRTGVERIDVVAHSMGTQLVRWYLRYGTAPVPEDGSLPPLTWAGARHVERALLVAPPNLGEAQALEVLLEGAQEHPLLPTYPPALAVTFAGAVEMIPRPRDRRVVYSDTLEPVDLYDAETWERLSWGPFSEDEDDSLSMLMPELETREARLSRLRTHMTAMLRHVERFHRALDVPATPPAHLHVHLFVGDDHPTRSVLLVDRETGDVSWADPEPGDGTVTRTSALGQSRADRVAATVVAPRSAHFVRSEHLPIVGDPDFIDHALYLLLEHRDPPESRGASGSASAAPPSAPAAGPIRR